MNDFKTVDDAEPAAGDAAGEHVHMQRGHYSAWAYVVVAALLQALVPFIVVAAIDPVDRSTSQAAFGAAAFAGVGLVLVTFWDRWRVTEAFASRFCVGIVNFSLFIAVPAALVYANTRLVLRLVRREGLLVAAPEPSPGAWR